MLHHPKSIHAKGASYTRRLGMLATAGLLGLLGLMTAAPAFGQFTIFSPGNLVVSRSVYQGTSATVTIGQQLPPSPCGTSASCTGKATDTGAFPADGVANPATGQLQNVFNNDIVDGSFGVTSPIFLDQITTGGTLVNTLPIDPKQLVTSFSSKSELGLNLSTDGTAITFMGYTLGPANTTPLVNQLDVSNSNTPGVIDPTNPVGSAFYRGVAQVNSLGTYTITDTNAYSGNNGRAAILANGLYYTVGNDNNGSGTPANIIDSTGAEVVVPGAAPGTPVMIDPTLVTHSGDKGGKDSNFRGVAISNNTLYLTKGSGSNGIDTVYQVGPAGTLPTVATAASSSTVITVAPGFPTALAKTAGIDNIYPFGMWFANPTTLYVADEGDGTAADASNSRFAGLQKWSLVAGSWQLDYVMQNGLFLGQQYSVPFYPTSLNPAPDGLRNLTGRVNSDGTATIWAITSTVSTNGDQGADPNQLVMINDNLANTSATAAQYEKFTILETAPYATVLRGVAFTPGTAPGTASDPAVLLTIGNTNLVYPGSTNVSVCVTPATNAPATGVVQILDGTTPLITGPLPGNGCTYWQISPGLSAGIHNITAFYSGDSNNPSGTSAVVVVTVAPATTYLSANCGSAFFAYGGTYSCNVNVGSTAGGAQGVITYSLDGGATVPVALSGGGASFSLSGLNAAQHTVSIGYAAQSNFAAASPSAQNFTVTQLPTQVQLTPSNYYPSAGSSLTLTATVSTYSFGALSGGTVNFLDNGTLIGTQPTNAQGQASLTITPLLAGFHYYQAQFAGTPNFAAETSNSVSFSAR